MIPFMQHILYKCRGKTFKYVIVDLKKPSGRGPSAPTSEYVQLSCAISLNRVSIMRPFNIAELRGPLLQELLDELRWQEEMGEKTLHILDSYSCNFEMVYFSNFCQRSAMPN